LRSSEQDGRGRGGHLDQAAGYVRVGHCEQEYRAFGTSKLLENSKDAAAAAAAAAGRYLLAAAAAVQFEFHWSWTKLAKKAVFCVQLHSISNRLSVVFLKSWRRREGANDQFQNPLLLEKCSEREKKGDLKVGSSLLLSPPPPHPPPLPSPGPTATTASFHPSTPITSTHNPPQHTNHLLAHTRLPVKAAQQRVTLDQRPEIGRQ
jgi:hypothetical protein